MVWDSCVAVIEQSEMSQITYISLIQFSFYQCLLSLYNFPIIFSKRNTITRSLKNYTELLAPKEVCVSFVTGLDAGSAGNVSIGNCLTNYGPTIRTRQKVSFQQPIWSRGRCFFRMSRNHNLHMLCSREKDWKKIHQKINVIFYRWWSYTWFSSPCYLLVYFQVFL